MALLLFATPAMGMENSQEKNLINEEAIRLYRKVNENFIDCDICQKSFACSTFWEVSSFKNEKNQKTTNTLKIKKETAPSIALNDLLEKGGTIDQTIALSLVRALIMTKIFENFDQLLKNKFYLPSLLLTFSKKIDSTMPKNPGESGYITNVKEYLELHPKGYTKCSESFKGFNVICIGKKNEEPLYLGFGPFFAQPKTLNQILEQLYQATIQPIKPTGDKVKDQSNRALIGLYTFFPGIWHEDREKVQDELASSVLKIM